MSDTNLSTDLLPYFIATTDERCPRLCRQVQLDWAKKNGYKQICYFIKHGNERLKRHAIEFASEMAWVIPLDMRG